MPLDRETKIRALIAETAEVNQDTQFLHSILRTGWVGYDSYSDEELDKEVSENWSGEDGEVDEVQVKRTATQFIEE